MHRRLPSKSSGKYRVTADADADASASQPSSQTTRGVEAWGEIQSKNCSQCGRQYTPSVTQNICPDCQEHEINVKARNTVEQHRKKHALSFNFAHRSVDPSPVQEMSGNIESMRLVGPGPRDQLEPQDGARGHFYDAYENGQQGTVTYTPNTKHMSPGHEVLHEVLFPTTLPGTPVDKERAAPTLVDNGTTNPEDSGTNLLGGRVPSYRQVGGVHPQLHPSTVAGSHQDREHNKGAIDWNSLLNLNQVEVVAQPPPSPLLTTPDESENSLSEQLDPIPAVTQKVQLSVNNAALILQTWWRNKPPSHTSTLRSDRQNNRVKVNNQTSLVHLNPVYVNYMADQQAQCEDGHSTDDETHVYVNVPFDGSDDDFGQSSSSYVSTSNNSEESDSESDSSTSSSEISDNETKNRPWLAWLQRDRHWAYVTLAIAAITGLIIGVTIGRNGNRSGVTSGNGNSNGSGAGTPADTYIPTSLPTYAPTQIPTAISTAIADGSNIPTQTPTQVPTTDSNGNIVYTLLPTSTPSGTPTPVPSSVPSSTPSVVPSPVPTWQPTGSPTPAPTPSPTAIPSVNPTSQPTTKVFTPGPTSQPSAHPSPLPTSLPSGQPTTAASTVITTTYPTGRPTMSPTVYITKTDSHGTTTVRPQETEPPRGPGPGRRSLYAKRSSSEMTVWQAKQWTGLALGEVFTAFSYYEFIDPNNWIPHEMRSWLPGWASHVVDLPQLARVVSKHFFRQLPQGLEGTVVFTTKGLDKAVNTSVTAAVNELGYSKIQCTLPNSLFSGIPRLENIATKTQNMALTLRVLIRERMRAWLMPD